MRQLMLTRRSLIETGVAAALLGIIGSREAWATGRPAELDRWLRALVGLKDQVIQGAIDVSTWQAEVETLNAAVNVADIVLGLDIQALTRRFPYDTKIANFADPVLPPEIVGAADSSRWFLRVFGMRRGGGLLPHVHNGMVSAHLVIDGSFRIRTHDRLSDLGDAVLLRPTRDQIMRPGETLTMTDRHDNQHWLGALEDRSMTLDIGVHDVPPTWRYGIASDFDSTVLVDPTPRPQRDGTIIAPVMSFEKSYAKFAR